MSDDASEFRVGQFVCPCCVRDGVEHCREHKPRTIDELVFDDRGKLVPAPAGLSEGKTP